MMQQYILASKHMPPQKMVDAINGVCCWKFCHFECF